MRRLGTDRVDLFWVHLWDFLTSPDEVMRALDDEVRAGKILYVGVSDAPAWCVAQANTLAMCRGWTQFVGLQVEYSLVERAAERELLPMASALGLGVTAWSPLAAGLLTGKYGSEAPRDENGERRLDKIPYNRRSERNLEIAKAVVAVAEEVDRTPAQVALNWVRQSSTNVIPILGARRASQLADNLACLEWRLAPPQLARLEAATAIDLGFPTTMIAHAADFVYGGTLDEIDGARERAPICFAPASPVSKAEPPSAS